MMLLATLIAPLAVWPTPRAGVYNCARSAPFHPSIHSLGNVGVGGWVHAKMALQATAVIDCAAYKGTPVRRSIAHRLASSHAGTSILEIGCGVGTLTSELIETGAFRSVTAMDTSEQMLSVARRRAPGATYLAQNGVDAAGYNVDVVVSAFVMHEVPEQGHNELLTAFLDATRKRRGDVWIFDISLDYQPSAPMRLGEPFVDEYLSNFETTVRRVADDSDVVLESFSVMDGHVHAWVLRHRIRSTSPHSV